MPKTLIVCCDGTWNTPDQQGRPTNVTKMTRAILPRAPDGTPQIVHYDEGVGTGNGFDRFVGGTLGVGLGKNVRRAYRFLALNYEPGDEIAMFGFSRGAFTVRSLAGLVNLAGLLRKGDLDKMGTVWDYYRTEPDKRRRDFIDPRWIGDRDPGVDFLGVWDTVGSLGIPGNLLRSVGRRRYAFHDVTLGTGIRRAYQALAIDEHRRNFLPAIWDTSRVTAEQEVEQVWFAGAHSNVGGGYDDPVLSDQAFLWMVTKARPLLAFDDDYLAERCEVLAGEEARGEVVDSRRGIWKFLGQVLRPIGADPTEAIHPSALARLHASKVEYKSAPSPDAPYRPFPYAPRNLEKYLSEKSRS
jgi:uncharacterized protein (DUF2235 family)